MTSQAIDPGEGDLATARAATPGTPSEASDVFLDARPFTPMSDLQTAKSPSTAAISLRTASGETPTATTGAVSPSPSRLSNLTLTPEGVSSAGFIRDPDDPKAEGDALAISPPFPAVAEGLEMEASPSSGSLPPPEHVRVDSLRSSDAVASKAVLEFRAEAGGSGPSRSHSNASSSAPSSTSNAPSNGAAAASISSEHETGSSLGRSGSWASTVPTSPELEIANAPLHAMGAAGSMTSTPAKIDSDAELVGIAQTAAVRDDGGLSTEGHGVKVADAEAEARVVSTPLSDDSDSASKTPVDERRPRAALQALDAGSPDLALSPASAASTATTDAEAKEGEASAPATTSAGRNAIFVPSDFAREPRRETSLRRQAADLAPRPGAVARLQMRSEESIVPSSDDGHSEAPASTAMSAAPSSTVQAKSQDAAAPVPAWRDKPLPPVQPQPPSPSLVSELPEFLRQFYAVDGVALDESERNPALSLDVPAPLPSLRLEESEAFREAVANGSLGLKPPMSQHNASQPSSLGSHSGGSSPSISSQSPAIPALESSPRRNGLRSAFSRSSKYLWRQSASGEALEAAAAVELDYPRIEVEDVGTSSARRALDAQRPSLKRGSAGSQLSAVDGVGTAMTRLSSTTSSLSGVSSGDGRADSVAPLPMEASRSRPGSRAGGLFHRHSKVGALTNAVQTSELTGNSLAKESSHASKSSISKRFSLHDAGSWSMKKTSSSASPSSKAGREDKSKSPLGPTLSRKSTRSVDGLSAMLSKDSNSPSRGASKSSDMLSTATSTTTLTSTTADQTPNEVESLSSKGKGVEMDRNGSKSSGGHRRHRSQDAAAFLSRGMSFLGSGSHTVKASSSSPAKRDRLPGSSSQDEAWWGGGVGREASPRAPDISEFAAAAASLSPRPSEATLRPSKLPVPSAKAKQAVSSSATTAGASNAHRSFKSFFEPLSGLRRTGPGSSRPSSPAVSERTSSRQSRPMTSLGFGGSRTSRDAPSRPNALTSDSINGLTASRGMVAGGRKTAGSAVSSTTSESTFVTALTTPGSAAGGRLASRTTVTPAALPPRLGSKGDGLTPAPRDKSSSAGKSATMRAASALGHIRPKTGTSTTGTSTVSASTVASRAKAEAASKSSPSLPSSSKRRTSGSSDKPSVASFAAEPLPPPRSTSVAAGIAAKRRSSSRSSQVPPSSPSRHFAAAAAAGLLPKSTTVLETAPTSRSGSLRPPLTVDTMSAAPLASGSALVTDDSPPASPIPPPAVKRKYSQPTLSIIDDRDFLQALEDVRQQHRDRAARRDSEAKASTSPWAGKKDDISPVDSDIVKRPSLKRESHEVGVTPRRPRALSADGRLISPGLTGAEFFSSSPTSSRADGASGSPVTPRASPQREMPQTPLERGVGRASGKLGESAFMDEGDWKKEVKALFVIRELVQTERSYARHLEGLLQAVNRVTVPEPHPSLATRRRSTSGLLTLSAVSSPHNKPASRSAHLAVMRQLIPQLIALSRALATSIDENPTAAGVGLAFRVMAPQLEASFLAWSEAIEGVMAALRYTEGPKGLKSRDRLGLITLPPAEDGSQEPPADIDTASPLAGRSSVERSGQRRRASGPAESVSAQSLDSPEILEGEESNSASAQTSTTPSSSRSWKRRSTITTPSSAAAAVALVKAEAAASALPSQTSFDDSPPVEAPVRAQSAWGFASKRAFGTVGSSAQTRPAPKGRASTMATNTPSNGRKALSALDIAIMPTQRLPRYLLLLRDLIANTPPASLTYARCAKALDILRHVAKLCDEASSSASIKPGPGVSTGPSASRSLTASSSSLDTTSVAGPTPSGSVPAPLKARPIWR